MPELVGTDSREMRWVRDTCGACGAVDELVYVCGDSLRCAGCTRAWYVENPTPQACDSCGSTGNVWRDPLHRRNEYLCIRCHDPDALFQNRWANKVRQSTPLNNWRTAVCGARGRGTDCKGEITWRGAHNMELCNKHAGKQGVGPNG